MKNIALLFTFACITIQLSAQKEITSLKKVGFLTNKTLVFENDRMKGHQFSDVIHTINFVDSTYKVSVDDENDNYMFSFKQAEKVTNLTQYKEKGVYNIRFEFDNSVYHFFARDTEGGKIEIIKVLVNVNMNSNEVTRIVMKDGSEADKAKLYQHKYTMLKHQQE